MTTLDELDAVARRAAKALDANRVPTDEIEAALMAVKRGATTVRPTVRRRRPLLFPVGVAAAAASVAAIMTVLVVRGDGAVQPVPPGSPIATEIPPTPTARESTTFETGPGPDTTAVGSAPLPPDDGHTIATFQTTTPSLTSPTTTYATPTGLPGPFTIDPTIESLGAPTVLFEATVGSGSDQIGYDACPLCDPPGSVEPLVADNGGVVILDVVNRRFVTATRGASQIWPLPDEFVPTGMVPGRDGNLYVVGRNERAGAQTPGVVLVFQSSGGAEPLKAYDVADPYGSLHAGDSGVTVTGSATQHVPYYYGYSPEPMGDATFALAADGTPAAVIRTYPSGESTRWELAPGDQFGGLVAALRDGSTLVTVETPDQGRLLVRLHTDGTASSVSWPSTAELGRQPYVDQMNIVVIAWSDDGQRLQVLRYPLP